MSSRKRRKSKKNKEILILVVLVLLIGLGFGIKKLFDNGFFDKVKDKIIEPEKKLKIIDLDSDTRPVGVLIDNIDAARPQVGLNDAYLVYEIIVEGGYTRLFALFKDVDTKMIGPVRSVRHYFIDYALENDAALVHYGWSPQAQSDIKSLNINNLNGLTNPGGMFWRDSTVTKAPHNAFTSMSKIREQMRKNGYDKKVSDTLLNYSIDEIDLSSRENAIAANNISIKYSNFQTTTYEYDSENKVYKRSMNGTSHVDRDTNEQYTVKNIIVYNVNNYAMPDAEDKGRQELENIGSGEGYYITDGYAIPITYKKTSRSSKTKYMDLNGNEIEVNDGNTYIQIQPNNQKTIIE